MEIHKCVCVINLWTVLGQENKNLKQMYILLEIYTHHIIDEVQ